MVELFDASRRGNPQSVFVIGSRNRQASRNTVRAKKANTSAYGAPHLTATHRADYSSTIATDATSLYMIPARDLIKEIVASLREVIAPAIAEQYPKSQAYMAAVVLEFVARQVEERSDIEAQKHAAMMELLRDLARFSTPN
jgi:hypothetical protein